MSLRRANARTAPSAPSVFDYPPDQPLVHVPRGALISGLPATPSAVTSAPTPRPYNAEGIIVWEEGERFWAMVLVGRSRTPTKQVGEVLYRREMYENSGGDGGRYSVKWINESITNNNIYGYSMYEMDSYHSYDHDGKPV